MTAEPEYWLRGPVEGVPPLLQPVAHALLQARDEAAALLADFPDELLRASPAGVASVGFHLRHMAGVIDRLFTYARGEALSREQRDALALEAGSEAGPLRVDDLLASLNAQVEGALAQLRATPENTLTEGREVGRQRLPSTVLGLLFHAAEHVQRHLGQLRVTAQVLRQAPGRGDGGS